MLLWCPMELIEKMLSLQPESNWVLAVSCNASTWQVPISTNVAFKKLISFPGMATPPLGAVFNSSIFCVLGLSSLWGAGFSMCLYWLWQDPTSGWRFSALLLKQNPAISWTLGEHWDALHGVYASHITMDLASAIPVFPPWSPTLSCLEICFQLRLATYYVLCNTFWQIQFDFALKVFLDLILCLWKVI